MNPAKIGLVCFGLALFFPSAVPAAVEKIHTSKPMENKDDHTGDEDDAHAHGAAGELAGGVKKEVAKDHDAEGPEHGGEEKHDDHEAEKGGSGHGHDGHAREGEEAGHAEEEPWADRVGEGKAVEAYDETGRLKLAAKAIARMGVKATVARMEGSGLRVPLKAVQKSKGKAFIYVAQADRWYERRTVTMVSRSRDTALLNAKLAKHELVVTEGSASLRAAELDLLAGESAGHGH